MIADVYSEVDAFPPKSPVIAFPSAMVYQSLVSPSAQKSIQLTVKAAFSILFACSCKFMCLSKTSQHSGRELVQNRKNLSIIREDNKSAVGLAKPFPITFTVGNRQEKDDEHSPAMSGAEP
jgi:hypothetical protein